MDFNKATLRILVRGDYKACYDFYANKLGLYPVWGDDSGAYTSFAATEGGEPCFAIFNGNNMDDFKDYIQPQSAAQPDTIVGVIPTTDIEGDYKKLKERGVEFIGKPTYIEGWGMTCVYFRDTEGNLFELNNATTI